MHRQENPSARPPTAFSGHRGGLKQPVLMTVPVFLPFPGKW